ncbi:MULTISPECIES: hypothetical protein [unclassified Geobacillus]|uniref:hypothetical protein n=1 Tax=unclassified Geobacillus TaxID=2642459 RepID=UPI000BE3F3D5|nr:MULTISPECIES: hypothetical protein [unclassified Geobacillus]PDM38793.1 hypothetical protein CN643_17405 [Parageobacillus yumthangensis]PUF85681.1 hypothetical protein DCC82_16065 [Geobacillus sp. LYN3]TXK86301.1 hypothetical protein FVE68_15220 [Geobacillus sp. AYS3]
MDKFKPSFEVTQVSSMQWNRTLPGSTQAMFSEEPIPISEETLNQLRLAIREEMKKEKTK